MEAAEPGARFHTQPPSVSGASSDHHELETRSSSATEEDEAVIEELHRSQGQYLVAELERVHGRLVEYKATTGRG